MKTFLLVILLIGIHCSFSSKAVAHNGGHYHQQDELGTWLLASGKTVHGNFFMGKDNTIVLEQTGGKLITVPLDQLTEQDRELAILKMQRFNELNRAATLFVKIKSSAFIVNKNWLLLGILISLVCSYGYWYRKAVPNRYLTTITLSSFLVLVVSFVGQSNRPPKTSAAFIDSAFAPYKPAVQTSWDSAYFHVASTGLPNHEMMVGIKSWQQQVPLPQNYTGNNQWSIPLQPEYAANPISTKTNFMRGAVALAVNGVPIFNALNNRGDDAFLVGELDQWGGHCGKGDDYHYHVAPLHLETLSGWMPIAFALDGFAVYASKEPDGTAMKPLDECHGHVGSNGIYHYHGTINYPYVIGAMKGKVATDESKPAPENQIVPQAFARPVRPPLTPMRGAVITDLKATANNAYSLTYQMDKKLGYVNYSWDANNYHFTFIDINGNERKETYPRRKQQ